VDPGNLHPSVRFGLEGALLTVLAEQRGESMAGVLGPPCQNAGGASQGHGSCHGATVHVNGLLDCSGGPQQAAAEAARLVRQGFKALKVKVCSLLGVLRASPAHAESKTGSNIDFRAFFQRQAPGPRPD